MKSPEKYNVKIGLGSPKDQPKKQKAPAEKRVMTHDQAFRYIDKLNYTVEVKAAIKKIIASYPANSMERALSRIDEIAAKVFQSSTGDLGSEQPEIKPTGVPVISLREFASRENVPLPPDRGAKYYPGGKLPEPELE